MEITEKPPGTAKILLAGGLLFSVWFIVLYPWVKYQFWQSDTFWLIETGRLILHDHVLPTHDTYTFTAAGAPWIVYQWLAEVIFGIASAIDGLAGVALLGGLLLAVLFFILIFRRMLQRGVCPLIAAMIIALTMFAYYPDFSSLRPQLFSFVLFWLMAMVCTDVRAGLKLSRALTATFVMAVVWANCHLSFLYGLVLLVTNLVGSALLVLTGKSDKKQVLIYVAMLAAFSIGTLVTPYGLALWSFVGNVHNLYYSQEVMPLTWPDKPILSAFGLSVLASCLYLRRRIDLRDFLTMAALLYIANGCTRLIAYFCIFCCLLIGDATAQFFASRPYKGPGASLLPAAQRVASSRIYPYLVILMASFVVLSQPTFIPRNIPMQAANYLSLHPMKGNMFCSPHAGSYLIYSTHGSIPVFIDTRIDLYTSDFVARALRALDYGEDWRILFYQYKITSALVPNAAKLRFVLDRQTDWKLIYRDREFSLYTPNDTP